VTKSLDQPGAPEVAVADAARFRATSVRRTEGVDAFQALQRVLYRSAKQGPEASVPCPLRQAHPP